MGAAGSVKRCFVLHGSIYSLDSVLCCGGMSQPDTREDFAKCFDAQCFGDILCEKNTTCLIF